MESNTDDLIPVFMPALIALLILAEDKKGTPLTKEEVYETRNNAKCIMMEAEAARKTDSFRGDLDPENCWYDWQMFRRETGRKPNLDPGVRFHHVRSSDAAYQQTIQDALDSISSFRKMLPSDGAPRNDALVKTELSDGDGKAFMWLNNVAIEGDNFSGELFEVPDVLSNYNIGDRLVVAVESLMDWMVNEEGRLTGGYSLRYHRAGLQDDDKADFDEHIGVTEYLST